MVGEFLFTDWSAFPEKARPISGWLYAERGIGIIGFEYEDSGSGGR
jgi:hypothetical protein